MRVFAGTWSWVVAWMLVSAGAMADTAYQIHHHDFRRENIKPYHPVRRAEIAGNDAIVFDRPEFVSAQVDQFMPGLVVGVYARSDMPLEGNFGRPTYWFEIGARAVHGWVWGSELNFLRIYNNQVKPINDFVKSKSKKTVEVRFQELNMDADNDMEWILMFENVDKKKPPRWEAYLLDWRGNGYTEIKHWFDFSPLEIWVEDVDLDRQEDLIVNYGTGGVQAMSIVKDVGGNLREVFAHELMRWDRSCQIGLKTRPSGQVDVSIVARPERDSRTYDQKLFQLSREVGAYIETSVDWIDIWTEQAKGKNQ